MSDSKWSSKNKLTTIGSGTTFCCLNEEDASGNVIVPVTGITNLTLPSVTGMTVGNLINVTPTTVNFNGGNSSVTGMTVGNLISVTPTTVNFNGGNSSVTGMTVGNLISVTPTTVNFNGGASMSINNTTMSVANNNLIKMYPNNINLNGGLLRVEHDSYEFDHFYAGIDYGSGKGLIKIDAYDGDPNYSRVELGINGKAIGVTGETNFKVGDGKLIDLKYDPTDYYNRSLNIGSGELLRLYKSQDGARNCNIGGTEGNILKAYVGTGGTNCFLSDNLISAESGTNNNFKVKVNDGSGELYLIDLVYGGGSNSNGVCGDYEYTNTFVSSIQKLGYLLELSGSQGGQICKLGENGLLLNINTAKNATNINTTASPAQNRIVLGNSSVTGLTCQVALTVLSDGRDKKDITPIENGIEFINAITPVEFTWNMRDGSRVGDKEIGFIAQDLQKAQVDVNFNIPGLVKEIGEDKIGVTQTSLIPIMTKAIQELSKEIENLKQQINDLKK